LPRQHVLARGGGVEAADDVHERRLARARRPHHRYVVVAPDVEVDAAQGLHLDPSHAVGLADPAHADHRALDLRLFAHHSYLKETAGFTLAARRAGKKPASTPIVPRPTEDARAVGGEYAGPPRDPHPPPLRGRSAERGLRASGTAAMSSL